MSKLIARYYKAEDDQQIVIYNEHGKLIEFPLKDRWKYGLPPLSQWKETEKGCEIEFRFTVVK